MENGKFSPSADPNPGLKVSPGSKVKSRTTCSLPDIPTESSDSRDSPCGSKSSPGDMNYNSRLNRESMFPSLSGFRNRKESMHSLNPVLFDLSRKNSININSNEKVGRRRGGSCFFKDTGDPAYDKLMRSYDTNVHYTKNDLKNMGRDIVRSIFFFANLQVPSNNTADLCISEDEPCGVEGKKDDDYTYSTDAFVAEVIPGVPLGTIDMLDSEMLSKPLLKPCVFSTQAIQSADAFAKSLLRIKCEMAIRKSKSFGGFESESLAGLPAANHEQDSEEEAGGGNDDSDSEPSVDNMPAAKLFGKKNFSNLNEKSLVKAVQKEAMRRRIIMEKTAKATAIKIEKSRLEEAATVAAAAEKELLRSKCKKAFGKNYEEPKKLRHATTESTFKPQDTDSSAAEKLRVLGRVSNNTHLPKNGRKDDSSSRKLVTPTKRHYFLSEDYLSDAIIDGRHNNDSKQFGIKEFERALSFH